MEDINEALSYASQMFMDLTGFIDIKWRFEDEDHVVAYNDGFEGVPKDDNWEFAVLVSKLTGWEPYHITKDEEWEPYGTKPYEVGLKRPQEQGA